MKFLLNEKNIFNDFPCLYKSTDSELVVMFIAPTTCIVLQTDGNDIDSATLFQYVEDEWGSCYDKEYWIKMPKGTTYTFEQN